MGIQTDSKDSGGESSKHSGDFAHFRIIDEIARGGMGVVLKGHDIEMGRDVAIKMLLEELGDNPLVVQRFVEEAQISGQLQHPGIVPVYELGVTADKRPFFAMKLVKGNTLTEELRESTRQGPELRRLLSIFQSVAQTMAYAHNRRVIHRDLKPSNVMVGAFGEVLLVDWGLAKVMTTRPTTKIDEHQVSADVSVIATVRSDSESAADRSTTGSILGTIAYMSPEQARGQVEELDERTDVFSLGAILCEILTGKPPYPRDKVEALEKARSGDLSHATDALDACGADEGVVALAKSCLEPARTDRPSDASVVAERIGAWLASSEARAEAARVEAAEARARAAGERRARWLTVGLAVSVLFAVLLIAGFEMRTQQERADRLRNTEEGVAESLSAASFARGSAKWTEARLAIAEARAHLESGLGTEELAARIEAEERAIDRDFSVVQRQRELDSRRERFLHETEALRSSFSRTSRAKLEIYPRLLEDFGVDMSAPIAEIEEAIRASELANEVAALLVDWARLLRLVDPSKEGEIHKYLQLALAVDDDPQRSALRRAIMEGDKGEILRIAREVPDTRLQPMTVIVLADELWLLNERDEAMRLLKEAELHFPDDFHLHAKLAARHMNVLDFDGAFVHLKCALAREPENSWLLASLGLMYYYRKDQDRALALCRQAVNANPDDAYARQYLGVVLAANGETEAAIKSYRKAVELDSEYVFAIRRLAGALTHVGEHAESLKLCLRAVELQPDDPSVLNSAAWRLATIEDVTLRDYDRALELAERMIDKEPDDPDYESTYGTCLYYAGRYEDSIEANGRALALSEGVDRERTEIFFLAMANARLGRSDEARAWLARGEQLASETESPAAEMPRFLDEARAVVDAE